jgi:DNA uptake protein ComE-like DNA-binding protein
MHRKNVRNTAFAIAIIFSWFCTGCLSCNTKQNPEQLREKTAEATAELKQDAKAVAQGVREGWSRNNPLDINKASREQLTSLPGITPERADRVIEQRPYNETHELVSRHVISEAEYERISDRITAKK